MKIVTGKEELYQDWKNNQSDDYGREIFRYAETWAELMEGQIEANESLEPGEVIGRVAKGLSRKADTSGITGFMYGMAVSVLSHAWKYGEHLRVWHNLDCQIGNEGERANKEGGVINPAMLVVGGE